MKKSLLTTLAALGILLGTTTLSAQDQETNTDNQNTKSTYGFLSNAITNKNIFSGMNFGNTYMNQPYIEVGNDDLSFGTWANFEVPKSKVIEVDYYLNAKKNFELSKNTSLNLTGTLAYYTFPNTTFTDAKEIKLNANLNTEPINLNFNIGKAFGDFENSWHASLTAKKDLPANKISDNLSASIDAEVFYNNMYFSSNKGLSHIREGASLTYKLDPTTSISLNGTIQQRLNDSFKDYVFNETYFSIGLNKDF